MIEVKPKVEYLNFAHLYLKCERPLYFLASELNSLFSFYNQQDMYQIMQ